MKNNRAQRILGMISLFPNAHDQGSWCSVPSVVGQVEAEQLRNDPSCGTTLCFAGWAAALYAPKGAIFCAEDGDNFFVPDNSGGWAYDPEGYMFEVDDPWEDYDEDSDWGQRYEEVSIMEFAEEKLDLQPGQSNWLFNSDRTADELREGVKYLMSHPNASQYELADHCQEY